MAEVRDQHGSPMAGATVIWTSSDDAVVKVGASGLAHAVDNGEATVRASVGASAFGTARITVHQVASAVSVTPVADTLVAGDTLRLAAEAFDANEHRVLGAAFSWSSSDPAVATVDTSGVVTGVNAGQSAVTATSGDASGHMELLVLAPAPTAIDVTPPTVALVALGDTARLTAEVFDQLGRVIEDAAVSWGSADETVVTVDATGLVAAVGEGMTTVSASSEDASGAAVLSVTQVVGSVVVSPVADTLVAGDTLRLAAEAFDANGHPVSRAAFSWASDDPLVATVDNLGLVTAVSPGGAAIAATSSDATGHMELRVLAPAPTAIDVRPPMVALTALSDTVRLTAIVLDQLGRVLEDAPLSWASADETVVTVDSGGLVTAAGEGTTRVTATAGDASAFAAVTVMQVVGSVVVTPAADTLLVGDTLRLVPEAFDANAHPVAGAAFSWSSSDPAVATVDTTGLLTGVRPGGTTITATSGGTSGHMELLVSAPVPTTIQVRPDSVRLEALGDTVRLSAELYDQLGRAIEGAGVSWSSGDEAVAIVDSVGLVVATGVGTTRVAATAGAASGVAAVSVMQVVDSVIVSPATDTIAPGETLRLSAEAFDANARVVAGAEFSWSSSDPSVATVDSQGLVTGASAGEATINAAAGGVSGRAEVLVIVPAPVAVEMVPDTLAFTALDDTSRLVAVVLDQRGRVIEDANVSWSSSDESVATVNRTGLVSALGVGRARVTATSGAASRAAVVSVVQVAHSVVVSPASAAVSPGGTVRLTASAFDANGHMMAAEFSWSSNHPRVASVDPRGLVRSVDEGVATISALAGDARGTSQIAVGNADRAALVALYEATDGPNWSRSDNWLTDAPLAEWFGVTVNAAGRVSRVDLDWNNVSGHIPPELGSLGSLEALGLLQNELTGRIPPELGSLTRLTELDFFGNKLTGAIPSQLGNLTSLERLSLGANQLTGAIPPQLGNLGSLEQLVLLHNELTGVIPPQLGTLASLETLALAENRLTGPIPSQLGSLENLTFLGLHGNELTGTIPPELGGLTWLRDLNLSQNRLTGPVPSELGRLVHLGHLRLSDNPHMVGALPSSLTALGGLNTLLTVGTDLCAPSEGDFQAWLAGVEKQRVPVCPEESDRPIVYLTQAVQSPTFPVPLVADEPALLRVFVTAPRPTSQRIPSVRATFHLDGAETYVAEIPAQTDFLSTALNEGDLALSANAVIPGHIIRPGLEMVVEIDPEGAMDPRLGIERRIPGTGRAAVDVRQMPPLDLTLIPFLWSEAPDSTIVGLIGEMAADPEGHELLSHTRTLLPVADLQVTAHEPVMSSTDDPLELLYETWAIRVMEGRSGHYMGMDSNLGTDGIRGVAYRPGRTSFSRPFVRTIAHELGHNMSLAHARCGSPRQVDADYPHEAGSIGAWGHDLREGGGLVPPSRPDLMSYCLPSWISDYHFSRALRYRMATEGPVAATAAASSSRSLLLWGGVDEEGAPFLEPTFVVSAPAALPASGGGEFELAGRTADGDVLFSLSFDMPEVADGEGRSSFAFALPIRAGWEGELASIALSGPGGTAVLDGDTDRPMVILRNPGSGQVRAFLRNPPLGALAGGRVDVGSLSPEPGLEALFSRGLPGPREWRR